MSTVLVLDANQRSALSVTRSLGLQGIKVICADVHLNTLAGASKFCMHRENYPDPTNTGQFIIALNYIIKKYCVEVIYPVAEITVYTLLENVDEICCAVLPFPDIKTVKRVSDKGALVKLCQEMDLRVPQSDLYQNQQDFLTCQKSYRFPVVLKPTLSRIKSQSAALSKESWINTAVTYANSNEELLALINSKKYFRDYPFLLQEYIAGYGSGVFLLYDKGAYVAHFAHKRLREKPPTGGVSVLCESIEPDPEQLAVSKKLLDEVGWHGVAMVEFKVDRQGKPYVIEVNPRFWGSLQLAVDAGVDFPAMLHEVTTNRKLRYPLNYKIGQRLRWLLGDVDRLYIIWKGHEYGLFYKIKSTISFLIPLMPSARYEVNRLGDMKPFWFEIRAYFRDLLK